LVVAETFVCKSTEIIRRRQHENVLFRAVILVVKPVRYICVVALYDIRRGRDVNVFDLIGVLSGAFVRDQVERLQQRPSLDHFQQLYNFLS